MKLERLTKTTVDLPRYGSAAVLWLPRSLVWLAAFVLLGSFAAAADDLSTTLQRGLFEEEANHDLPAAIQVYETVVRQFERDRKLAATAVFRLGECYRKQGRSAEANRQYERVIREFADQPVLLDLSRKQLAAGLQPGTERAVGLAKAPGFAERSSPFAPLTRIPAVSGTGGQPAWFVLDNTDAMYEGNWTPAKASPDKWGPDYRFASTTTGQTPTATATYRPKISTPGTYQIEVWHPMGQNRCTNAQWIVQSPEGVHVLSANQQRDGGRWVPISPPLRFEAGSEPLVKLVNLGATGSVVVADAIRLVRVEDLVPQQRLAGVVSRQPSDAPVPESPESSPKGSIIIDNTEAHIKGSWASIQVSPGKWGRDCLLAIASTNGTRTVTYRPAIPKTANYHVDLWYSAGADRTTSAKWFIDSVEGRQEVSVNQQINGGRWHRIAENVKFEAGDKGWVEVLNQTANAGSTRFVVADAVRFVPADAEPGDVVHPPTEQRE